MSIKKFIKHGFQKPLSNTVNYLLKAFNIFVIYRIGNAIGDQLCMSAVVRLIDEQYSYRIVVISSYPEIFYNNPRVWKNIGVKRFSLYISRVLRFFSGPQLENFLFKNNKYSFEEYMRSSGKGLHLVEAHSLHFNHGINYNIIQNEIHLSKSEIKKYAKKFNLPESYSVIQPNSKRSYTPNKQWSMENFQQVVDKRNDIHWVQVGGQNEFLLDSVEDYRDETTLRELFYIVSRSQFVFANEGLINHIASAFKVTSYVISSGFSCSSLAKYDNSVFFDASGSCENSPCWLLDECGVSGKPCLSNIDPETVVSRLP
jgi:ADP-heptose:LPS heptosyltransferase